MPYLVFGGFMVDFVVGGYDDSLTFTNFTPADVEVIWLDVQRLSGGMEYPELLQWLKSRLTHLRTLTTASILVATWTDSSSSTPMLSQICEGLPGVFFADLGECARSSGKPVTDSRSEAIAGTPLTGSLHPVLARELSCRWLPALLLPPIKAIVLDLDQTLHSGVLGEDGVTGVRLTEGHRGLQSYLSDLRARGIFLALLSRNEREDVEALFAQREDYPLRWSDFSAAEVSWQPKSEGLRKIAEALRIAPDAMVLVDDNPGELMEVARQMPELQLVHAADDAGLTQRALAYCPGLWRWREDSAGAGRVADLRANSQRESVLRSAASNDKYLASLNVLLTYRLGATELLPRLHDLSVKTNQFNLALRRFTAAELSDRLVRPDCCVAAVALSDRLADSGVIALIVVRRAGNALVIEEVCVSCRALGRTLEDAIVIGAIQRVPLFANCEAVTFRTSAGPRNQPARAWIERLAAHAVPEAGEVTLGASVIRNFALPPGLAHTTLYEHQ